jgi:hypothetical protein
MFAAYRAFGSPIRPLPGTPPVPQKMLFAQKPLISLDFISFAPQFPENREFNREFFKIAADLPLFGFPERLDRVTYQDVRHEFPAPGETGNFFGITGNSLGRT